MVDHRTFAREGPLEALVAVVLARHRFASGWEDAGRTPRASHARW